LLLRRLPPIFGSPRRIILCDLAGQRWRLEQLADELRGTPGWAGEVAIAEAGPAAPAALYQADVIVAATSTPGCVDAALLRPGAILVDDSFPPCLDTAAAIRRMREAGDVLVVGGGLLDCGPSQRIIYLPAGAERLRALVSAQVPPQASASCQLESLLQAADPTLPLIHGLVGQEAAERYWQAVPAAGFGAAPLHLEDYRPDPAALALQRA
ncbi:MAG TPA: hypothetical protein VGE07_21565, partial [Herpetosiphonaceae bacterium]